MKNLFPAFLLLLGLIFGFLGLYSAFYAASFNDLPLSRPVKFATTDWEPFVGEQLPEHGPVGKLVFETTHRMGFKPEFSYSSWSLCIDKTRHGKVVGSFPGIRTDNRKKWFYFSKPIMTTEYVLFSKKSTINTMSKGPAKTALDPYKYKFGKVKGYEVWDTLAAVIPDSVFKEYITINEAFEALANDSIHFLPEAKIVGLAALRQPDIPADASQFGFLDFERDPIYGQAIDFHLMVPKRASSKEFIDKFNEMLDTVRENSSYDYEIKQFEENLGPPQQVELHAPEGASFTKVSASGRDGQSFLVPRGARAVVIRWPDLFLENDNGDEGAALCKVKLLNGPMRGRVVLVDPRSVSIIPSSY